MDKKNLGPKSLKGSKTLKGEKTLKAEKDMDSTLTESDINISLNSTGSLDDSDLAAGGAVGGVGKSPAEMLQLVVRTLTQFFPKVSPALTHLRGSHVLLKTVQKNNNFN